MAGGQEDGMAEHVEMVDEKTSVLQPFCILPSIR